MLALNLRIRKKSIIIAVLGIVSAIIIAILFSGIKTNPYGETQKDRTAYLAKLGYSVEDGSETKTEIKIPKNFDNVYGEYNETQKSAGFDLSDYSGCTAIMYSYTLSNFEDCENVYANLIVYNKRIIGGDLSSIEKGGFTLPLTDAEN